MPQVYTTGLQPHQIEDLVNNTLHRYFKDSWIDLSMELQRYFAHKNFLLGNRLAIQGGDQLQWQVKVRNTGNARNSGMYAKDDIKVLDVTKNCKIDWTMQTTNMAYDIYESAFNSGNAVRILNYLRARRHDALSSYVELQERNFWSLPLDTSEEEMKKPRGVPYWIVRNASTGWHGALPLGGGHTTVAGLDPNVYTSWRNWTGQFATISKRDLVRKLREAHMKCDFRAPVPYPDTRSGKRPRYRLATTYEMIAGMEEILEQQNQNLGNDIASKDGDVTFRKTPVHWVPYLDENQDTTGQDATHHLGKNPIYGFDLNAFQMVYQSGKFMNKSKALQAPEQHTVRHVHWDSWTQYKCVDRRSQFVLTQSV